MHCIKMLGFLLICCYFVYCFSLGVIKMCDTKLLNLKYFLFLANNGVLTDIWHHLVGRILFTHFAEMVQKNCLQCIQVPVKFRKGEYLFQ